MVLRLQEQERPGRWRITALFTLASKAPYTLAGELLSGGGARLYIVNARSALHGGAEKLYTGAEEKAFWGEGGKAWLRLRDTQYEPNVRRLSY